MQAARLIAVAVVLRGGDVLIGLRPEGVALAGFWEFPGGKVEPAESPAEAAVRECREETGLRVRVIGEFPSRTHDYDHGAVDLRFFRCLPIPESQRPQSPYRWVPCEDLTKYTFPPANTELIAQLVRVAGNGSGRDDVFPR